MINVPPYMVPIMMFSCVLCFVTNKKDVYLQRYKCTIDMKKLILLGISALVLLMTACSDKPVIPEQLPVQVKTFIQQTYPGETITFAQKDLELTGWKYEVFLADGTHIDFDTDDVWDKIESPMARPIPVQLIPAPIATHLQANFPGTSVTKIDKERNGYEIELATGIELKYNKQGALMEMDD